ncbi:MAG: peptidylprolyl isomerase [Ruminiclostridium sp.]
MKKAIAAIAAVIIVLTTAGCSGNSQENTTQGAAVTESPAITSDRFPEWNSIDKNTVVASVEGADSSHFDITFGDFYREYLYYLISYGITDDMSEESKEECETYRDDIITYLTFERIFLYEAENTYGCGEKQLTEEDLKTIKDNADAVYETWCGNYYSSAAEMLGSEASDDEITKKCEELLKADLAECGLSEEIFYEWEKNDYIQQLLGEKICEGVTATDEETEAMYSDYVAAAKELYESDKAAFEQSALYNSLYAPEGARKADHILVEFSGETIDAILEARDAGNDEEAQRLIDEAKNTVSDKVEEISALIKEGKSFDDLNSTYNADGEVTPFTVIPDSTLCPEEYTKALFALENAGDISEPVVSDYGFYFIRYCGEAVITEEEIYNTKIDMKEYLIQKNQQQALSDVYMEWLEKYPYEIDYELLKITPGTEEEEAE